MGGGEGENIAYRIFYVSSKEEQTFYLLTYDYTAHCSSEGKSNIFLRTLFRGLHSQKVSFL
jgi:hypothetical protein